jgi:hypothetical protein
MFSTRPRTSEVPSFALVCPRTRAAGSFTEITAVRPSRVSSPESASPDSPLPFFACDAM